MFVTGLTGEGIAWAITAYHAANWHPLTWLSHMLDCQLYGLKPGGHHLTNVLLHAAAAVLLFLALRRMTGGTLAQRMGGGGLRHSSPAGRVGRLGGRAQGRIERAVLHVDPLVLRPLRRASGIVGPVLVGGGLVCPGVDGQADAGDVAVCAPLAGLLAAGEAGTVGGGRGRKGTGIRRAKAHRAPSHRLISLPRRLVVEKIPLFVLAAASCLVTLAAQRDAMRSLEQLAFPGESPMPRWLTSPTWENALPGRFGGPLSSSQGPAAGLGSGCRGRRAVGDFHGRLRWQGGSAPTCSSAGSGILGRWCR